MSKDRQFGLEQRSMGSVSHEHLQRALVVSAQLTKRYKGSAFEDAALDLFARLERELETAENRRRVNDRAEALLRSVDA